MIEHQTEDDSTSCGTVVVLSSTFWGYTWQCYQQIATQFAIAGYKVFFVQPLSSHWHSSTGNIGNRAINRLTNPAANLPVQMEHPVPAGLEIARPPGIPDKYWAAQLFNKHIVVPRFVKHLTQQDLPRPLIIYNYLPLRYTLEIQKKLKADVVIYDAVYDFDRVPGSASGAWVEPDIVAAADLVFANSPYHVSRMLSLGADVTEFLPAVDTTSFEQAKSNPHLAKKLPLCGYFGTLNKINQDIDLLREVSHRYPLRIIGPADEDYEGFSAQTQWYGPLPFTELPRVLSDVDVLLLPYFPHEHVEAVTPAKIFECLATGKPTIAIGLSSLERFSDYLYLCETTDEFLDAIEAASQEDQENAEKRIALARENSQEKRIEQIIAKIDTCIDEKTALAGSPTPNVAYLSPSYHPYRVPVFEALNQKLRGQLAVFTLQHASNVNDELALTAGNFPMQLVKGRRIELLRHQQYGTGTALGVMLTPRFPFQLRAIHPKIVVSNNFNLWTFTALMFGYRTIIFWEGTAHTERTVTGFRKWIRRWIAQKARGFVVNGELSRRYLIEQLGVCSQNITTGGLSAEPTPEGLASRALLPREKDTPIRFLFVGRLIELKGVNHLLDALAIVNSRASANVNAELLIVGDGPEQNDLDAQTAQLGISDIVTFVGYVTPDQVWQYYEQADVFVLPTLQDNWPLVVAEAMAIGMPVLLSKYAGSIPDLIEESKNGFAFDPRDHKALAKLLEWYMHHPDCIAEHARRSQEIIARYTPEHAADAFYQAITTVVEQDRQTTGR